MHVHVAPSSLLPHTSPLVVPKYTPTGSRWSVVMPWRFTVYHALDGIPLSMRVHVSPASFVRYTAGRPSGLVRGHTSVPSIGKTHAVLGSRGWTSIGKPMSPT